MMRIYQEVKQKLNIHLEFDDSGSIGKRYRRHDNRHAGMFHL